MATGVAATVVLGARLSIYRPHAEPVALVSHSGALVAWVIA